MDFYTCAQCGVEIEGQGIRYRGRDFCCDECCDEFESDFTAGVEPDDAALSASGTDDLDDELGYRSAVDAEEEFGDDDEYEIKPEDF